MFDSWCLLVEISIWPHGFIGNGNSTNFQLLPFGYNQFFLVFFQTSIGTPDPRTVERRQKKQQDYEKVVLSGLLKEAGTNADTDVLLYVR